MPKDTGPNLPQEVEEQRPILALFTTYLGQLATKDALCALAAKDNQLKVMSNYLHTLTIVVGSVKDEKGLLRLAKQAPALHEVVKLARHLGSATIPPSAIPPDACIDALLKWYHEWVQYESTK